MSADTGHDRQHPWPQHVKREALDLAARDGYAEASRVTGVGVTTIRKWVSRASKAAGVELVENGRGVAMPWNERRDALVASYGERAQQAAQKAGECLDKGRMADAKNAAVVSGICVDKFMLLGGMATSRSETYSVSQQVEAQTWRGELDDKVDAMLTELQNDETMVAAQKVKALNREADRWRAELAALEAEGGGDVGRGSASAEADAETP